MPFARATSQGPRNAPAAAGIALAILKEFAVLENTPNVPALDLPTLDIVSTARGFGCAAAAARTKQELQAAFSQALRTDGPTLIAVPIRHQLRPLVPPVGTA